MMAQNADPAGKNLYRARHYSVIPLGPRSGLISWVDGTTPVFALYKRWQQRELAKPNAKGKNLFTNLSNFHKNLNQPPKIRFFFIFLSNTTVPRPSELFYNKLVEHGVSNIENRKEWPLAVLKEVLTELTNETPSDLRIVVQRRVGQCLVASGQTVLVQCCRHEYYWLHYWFGRPALGQRPDRFIHR
ncbi:unnamed protein product [Ceutorhynchus assimilis]|uniref:Uncharacterized protein n=1 Tax=Ceutorhynchus assimilis TaxID=467358 RepID=A0A9N9MII5_9CUCU|nr:unnamed protein product [Ceutorhynchus assimilis]